MPFLARRPVDYYLLWLVAIVSLVLNAIVINSLLQARAQVAQAAAAAADGVASLRASAIDYQVEIHEALPVSYTLKYKETFTVPISVSLPIDTLVNVPLTTPFGEVPLEFPVSATVPIRLNPAVPLDLAVPISLTVPVDVSFPIHVELQDTPLGASLSDVEAYLRDAARSLGAPMPAGAATATP
jgi:hypothetical protein